ncbi:hypothetical protein CXB51_035047 [Gossypium anomalum]|uniref:Integrase catalytic domain-containing protein n=1 Tax=Gossypium anomalum TaxID=47600 RepID=A0A8J5XQ93_9ROSI|nr:hypothetical protein CXB51_035047 [Gossypium anomalum]
MLQEPIGSHPMVEMNERPTSEKVAAWFDSGSAFLLPWRRYLLRLKFHCCGLDEKEDGPTSVDRHLVKRLTPLGSLLKLYVIEKPLPDEPPADASRADKDAYKKHLDEMVDVGCLMLATMNPELQKQHEDMVAYDMIEHLKELYQGQARQERFDISKALFQCKLAEGSPVGPHVLKMIGYIESPSKLGFPLSQELATDVILQSLPDSYNQFVLNFNMNEIDKTLPQLLSMLRTAEGNMKKVGPNPILMVHNNKGKGKAKVLTKPKGKETALSILRKSRRPKQAERLLQRLQRSRTLARGDVDLRVGNGARVAALAVGTYTLSLPSGLGKTIETLRSDRGGEYSSLEFDDLLKECGIVSQLTPPGNGVSERRNRTLLDMVRSMMSHADLPTSFWGHALETTIFTLNRVPSKSVQKTPYEMWTGKRPSMSFMKIWGYEACVKHQTSTKVEPKSERCIFVGYPKETKGYYFFNPTKNKVLVARTSVFLEREFVSRKGNGRKIELEEIRESQDTTEPEIEQQSLRERHAPERYGFLITTSDILLIDQDEPRTYQEAVASPDSKKWLEAMRSEMDSMYENQVWTLVDPPEGIKPIGCKWVFKKKTDMDAMFKSIKILLTIAAFHDYEIWQMDVKTAFLNGKLEEDVYMTQPEGFVDPKDAGKIYEPCVYKKVSGNTITFLVLYVDDILIIGNGIPTLQSIKTWLGSCFFMKDLGEATYILGVKIYRDRSRRLLGLSQGTYIDKVLKRFNMEESKRGFLHMRHGISLSKEMCPSTPQERERMSKIPYASAIGFIMYAMLCTSPDVSYALSMMSRYQVDPGEGHWTTVKNILKYLKRTKDTFLIYGSEEELSVKGYTDASFQTDKDDSRLQLGFVFCLNGGAVSWKSSKQSTVADSTTEAEYIAASEAAKEAVWIKKFITELGVVPSISDSIELQCDNNGAIAQAKEPKSH